MPIEFNSFPTTWRLPLYWAEIDPSRAGTGQLTLPALLVGQVAAGATATPNIPVPVGNPNQGASLFGPGSMLARMLEVFFANNSAQEVWCLPVPDPVGVKASGTIKVTSPPSQAGTISLYIAGQLIQIGVGASDTIATVAANMVTAINGTPDLPVTAALSGTTSENVVLTCKWVGLTGNDISMTDTLHGSLGGEALPTGLAFSYTGVPANSVTPANMGFLTGGTGVPIFTTAISNLGDDLYEYVALPYTDSTSLLAWQIEYGFQSTGRWGWMRQLYGQIYGARRDTYSNLLIWGATQNNGVTTVMEVEPATPSPVWEVTAAYDAEAALALSNDPARPLQTLEFLGVTPAPKPYRFTLTELNLLAATGLATQHVDASGFMAILRETTTYQLNAYGQSDTAYTDITTVATLSALLRNQRQVITTKFPRYKLADDGTLFGPGQKIVTPSLIRAELVSEYAQDEFNGLVEDARTFAKNLIVERDSKNPDRVNVLYPPNLIGQLRIFAVLAQFRLLGQQQTTVPA
jgi:phage tail sheath gpL-like